jgi:hypothetical protein
LKIYIFQKQNALFIKLIKTTTPKILFRMYCIFAAQYRKILRMQRKNFLDELRWRNMLHDSTPGLEEALNKGMSIAYIGFDPNCTGTYHW